jgi:hypothetical protein
VDIKVPPSWVAADRMSGLAALHHPLGMTATAVVRTAHGVVTVGVVPPAAGAGVVTVLVGAGAGATVTVGVTVTVDGAGVGAATVVVTLVVLVVRCRSTLIEGAVFAVAPESPRSITSAVSTPSRSTAHTPAAIAQPCD